MFSVGVIVVMLLENNSLQESVGFLLQCDEFLRKLSEMLRQLLPFLLLLTHTACIPCEAPQHNALHSQQDKQQNCNNNPVTSHTQTPVVTFIRQPCSCCIEY